MKNLQNLLIAIILVFVAWETVYFDSYLKEYEGWKCLGHSITVEYDSQSLVQFPEKEDVVDWELVKAPTLTAIETIKVVNSYIKDQVENNYRTAQMNAKTHGIKDAYRAEISKALSDSGYTHEWSEYWLSINW